MEVVERLIVAPRRDHMFFGLSRLHRVIGAQSEAGIDRAFRKLAGTRRSLFEELDQPALKGLPKGDSTLGPRDSRGEALPSGLVGFRRHSQGWAEPSLSPLCRAASVVRQKSCFPDAAMPLYLRHGDSYTKDATAAG